MGRSVAADRENRRAAVRRFAITAVLAALAVVVVYVVMVRTTWGQELDADALEGRHFARANVTVRSDDLLESITTASLAVLAVALALVAVVRRRLLLAVGMLVALGGAVVSAEALKRILTRPDVGDFPGFTDNSYPSGHATIGMSLSLAMIVVVAHRWRWIAAILAAFVATAFGTAVLTAGWHRPSDTIGACFLSLAWFSAVMGALVWWRGEHERAPAHSDRIEDDAGGTVTAIAAAVIVAMLVISAVVSVAGTGVRTSELGRAYAVALVLIDVTGVFVVAVFHLLMRGSPDPRSAIAAAATPRSG